ncbi:hypothetical protein PUV54_11320 [Hyphococcus flavus]|uniref:Helix-turn-helix domain-containing protein n=1 Tax=Hyphococcus flavus TaxID=1866326 RepID=A0AAE9ZGR1_9PROT|nr:hypothetical protein [Hyphococcus flavus]WDI30546.1 hypothetical protein PUV54_11320 [Hyphococcus flavus]
MPSHNKTGRSKKLGQFVPITNPMAKSAAWRSLSGGAVKVYVELHSRYNGRNNGDLSLSYADAAALLQLGKSTIKRAFDELTEKGFIIPMRKGHFYGRRAATWAVTDRSIDLPKHAMATNAWREWKPASQKLISGTEAERKAA